ncbi:MAG: hypothetical protein ACRDL8_03775, partial [Solirubrobacteraceae bacterium]
SFDQTVDRYARAQLQRPGEHLTAVLGLRPATDTPGREAWDQAGLEVERYRARYQINPAEPTALGAEPEHRRRDQRHDRDRAAHQILDARRQLGLAVHDRGPIEEKIRRTPHLAPDRGIDHGWEIGL